MFTIYVDHASALAKFGDISARQIPYAVKIAMNNLAKDVQEAEREGLKKNFHLRRKAFNLRGIKILKGDWATKSTWRVVISISAATDYLDKFEAGGFKLPTKGKYVWVPSREFKSRIIETNDPLHPKNLTFTRNSSGQMKGNQRTFMIRGPQGLMVLQRVDQRLNEKGLARSMRNLTLDNVQTGMGPQQKKTYGLKRTGGTRLLYILKERVTVKAQLQFHPIAQAAVSAAWSGRMLEAFAEAQRTAR